MGERSIDGLPTVCTLTGDRAHNLSMCPGQESNLQPFSYGSTLQATEPHWPGLCVSPDIPWRTCRGGATPNSGHEAPMVESQPLAVRVFQVDTR